MSFLETYRQTHTHPVNRFLHAVGIPMILISLPLFFWKWKIALFLFIFGWILQFLGHAIEGKKPAFFSNPIYFFIGVVWWFKKICGLEKKEDL